MQTVLRSDVSVDNILRQGVPSGCSLRFTIAYQDSVYRNGQVAMVDGSISWMPAPKPHCKVVNLKIIGGDFDGSSRLSYFAIPHAYVSAPGMVTSPLQVEERYECDNPNAFCGVYGNVRGIAVGKSVLKGGVTVAFSRRLGGMDVGLPITVDDGALAKFGACLQQLTDDAIRCLEGSTAPR